MYQSILVPTDGSKGAKRGVEHAIELAGEHDATVHALFVLDERIHGGTPALSSDEVFLEEMEHQGEDVLDELRSDVEGAGLQAVTHCVRGVPYEKILDYATENDVDLIVMGKHGLSEHGSPHIGSSTERVVRLADVPVLPV
jgi:nucleotide-binding universal stress UspA family protein